MSNLKPQATANRSTRNEYENSLKRAASLSVMGIARTEKVNVQIFYPTADHQAAQERVRLQKLRLRSGDLTEKLLQQNKSPINDAGHSGKTVSDARTQTESAHTGNESYDLELFPATPQDIAAETILQTLQVL